uniref:Ig-like domain-containing protein n=1 Tax=Meleagris gallopavo TaxID=9103 RepID=A0A803YJQ1_MELGA
MLHQLLCPSTPEPFYDSFFFSSFFLYFSFSHVAYRRVNVEAGHEAVLDCPSVSKLSLLMVTWKIKSSTSCFFAYRRDFNESRMLNCSERMMWKYSPDHDLALRIYPVNLNDEGNYSCEIVTRVSGHYLEIFNSSRSIELAVCQATAGKPAAKISWIPASNHSVEKDVHHLNGTVTRVSYISWVNTTHPNVTCLVTHPAVNQTLSLDLSGKEHHSVIVLHHTLVTWVLTSSSVTGFLFQPR